jgi:hypothetical protein
MSVGTIITVNQDNIIIKIVPHWPWPIRDSFPRLNCDGTKSYFTPRPYYEFRFHTILDTTTVDDGRPL